MSALVPYNNGGFSSQKHFGFHKQNKNYYYDQRFFGQQPSIPRPFPMQPYFSPTNRYPAIGYNQFGRSNLTTDLMSLNRANQQYRYAQYIRYMNEMQNRNWKREGYPMPLPRQTESFPEYYTTGPIYQYEKETRYIPYIIYAGRGGVGLGTGGNAGFGYLPTSSYTGGLTTALAPTGGAINLPPKIRVIFIPPGTSPLQQPCTGALGMPPFFFNRMAQPLCSLPLPPPLPQIASLPLTPSIQQMVMQRYANPVAVLPFIPNWQLSPPMLPYYPQILQPQQQSNMPISSLGPSQSTPQSYIPSAQFPINMPMLPSYASSVPFSSAAISSDAQYSNNDYSNTCRACIPAPPPLNISVTGHCWIQHCCACHYVPADTTNPNTRPSNGRFTPLLRQPTVQQNAYNPIVYQQQQQQQQQQQYPHINTSMTMRPWLHDIPPLPPGAVVISDTYATNNDSAGGYYFSQNYAMTQPRVFTSIPQSKAPAIINTEKNKINKNRSRKSGHKKRKDHDNSQPNSKSNSMTSISHMDTSTTRRSSTSSSSLCSLCNASKANKEPKSDTTTNNNQQNLPPEQLSAVARNVNLRFNYQPPDLQSVYNNNPYLKSSDTDSTSLSNPSTSPNSLSIKEENHGTPSSSVYFNPMEEDEDKKSISTLSPTLSQSERPVKRIIIIRQFRTSSPSIISTISSNLSLNIIENTFDSISPTSTIQTDQNTATMSETF